MPIANARMYSATPAVKQAWKALLGWALARAGLEWDVLEYDAPAPLSALWARDDLGCVLMCGLPFTQRAPRPALVASPVPVGERYAGRPVYFTDLAVRADAPYRSLEDTFGGVVGFTLADSYSGCVALRAHLLPQREARGAPLYRGAVGGFATAALAAPDLERLRDALLEAGTIPELGAQRKVLQLARFAVPREQDYATIGSALAKSRSFPDAW
jgi:hypothetical protein